MFQDNVKKYRNAKHLSQEDFAMRSSIVRQTVSKWEKGSSLPDVEMLIKIADVFVRTMSLSNKSRHTLRMQIRRRQ